MGDRSLRDSRPATTVIVDLDGVVYLGQEAVAGAGDALNKITDMGMQLLFATNNSSATPNSVASKIHSLTGYPCDPTSVVTCSMATAAYVAPRYRSALVVGPPGLIATLHSAGVALEDSEPEAVVVGIDFDFTYQKLDAASRAIRSGAAFIATNTDANYPTPTGLAPGAGSVVAAVAAAAGRVPVVCGKPEQPMIDLLGTFVRGGDVWMVGDRQETDIALAAAARWTSVLTMTGVVHDRNAVSDTYRPDHIVDSIADLPRLLRAEAL